MEVELYAVKPHEDVQDWERKSGAGLAYPIAIQNLIGQQWREAKKWVQKLLGYGYDVIKPKVQLLLKYTISPGGKED